MSNSLGNHDSLGKVINDNYDQLIKLSKNNLQHTIFVNGLNLTEIEKKALLIIHSKTEYNKGADTSNQITKKVLSQIKIYKM